MSERTIPNLTPLPVAPANPDSAVDPGAARVEAPASAEALRTDPIGPVARRLFPLRYLLLVLYAIFCSGCFALLVRVPSDRSIGIGMPVWMALVGVGVLLLLQAAFLSGAPHWRWPRPTRRRPMMVSQIAGAMIATLFSIGIILTLVSLAGGSLDGGGPFRSFLFLVPFVGWVGWLTVFATLWTRAPVAGFRRVYRLLVAGSWLELLITLPVDAQVRKRTSCYCDEGSFFAMMIGLSLAAWAFGPGLVLLFLTRRVQRRADLRVCIQCGYDLRGLTEPRCPECGKPFSRRLLEPPAANPT